MNFIVDCIRGIALGAGAILPGISSGVLCVVFGIYDKLINSILGFFKDTKNNFQFLFPIFLGIGIGVVIFGNILKLLFANFPIQTKYAFLGLILGSLPIILKNANNKNGFRLHYVLYTVTTFLLAVFLIFIENNFYQTTISANTSFLFLIFAGFIMSIGVVFPGVSSSVLLMILGVYDIYLIAVSTVNFSILFPMGIGLVIGGIIFLFIIRYCLEKYFSQTYYCIIGFVLGSTLIMYPGFEFSMDSIIGITFFIICFSIAYSFEKKSK